MCGRSFKEHLSKVLSQKEIDALHSSLEIIGHIAILKLPEELLPKAKDIASALMTAHKSIHTVLRQSSPVDLEFRLRQLKYVAGIESTVTTHREHGCVFNVDPTLVYFSPRLQFEHLRVARQIQPGETIVNLFAGVGSFSIAAAKKAQPAKVYSIDINAAAVRFMRENIRLNKVEGIVEALEGDARLVVHEHLVGVADRVLMPLPEKAHDYLDVTLEALKPRGGVIHYYDFHHVVKGEKIPITLEEAVSPRLQQLGVSFTIPFARIVRSTGP
ncbi:MAG: class I SAM-dependent methyltransferase family protein, partial [Candidatus Bathyarchaeia archaeon]